MYVAEFSLHAKMGHYAEVSEALASFASRFLASHAALQSVLVIGDPASGLVRAVGVWKSKEDADKVTSDPAFAKFNDEIASRLVSASDRIELELIQHFQR